MAVVSIDVETTGLGHKASPPREDAVLQVGIAWRGKNAGVRTWSELCNPGMKFLAGGRAAAALQINGIAPQAVLKARPARTVAGELWRRIRAVEESCGEAAEFRAYNRAFDQGFLAKSPWKIPERRWGECIMRKAAYRLAGCDRLKLERAMAMLEIAWPGPRAHDAAYDAHAALLIDERFE